MTDGWPVTLRGVTETIVTTLGPTDAWNVAALGVRAPVDERPATARTWGRTRTRRNFRERGEGYVQFTRDPVDFVDAALAVREEPEPVLDSADASVRVEVACLDDGTEAGTEWVDWALTPVESSVACRTVPTTNRGYAAVVEATVAASRLDVATYDRETLIDRVEHLGEIVAACGGEREQAAFSRLREHTEL